MHIVDHIFILLLFVVQPIYGAWDTRRYFARIEAGQPSDRVRFYRETTIVEWVFLAAVAIAWIALDRPAADLGFRMLEGVELWGGVSVLVVMSGLLLHSWQHAKRTSLEDKAKQAESFGKLVHFLPQNRRDLRYFFGVSITAGIVEEIVYRGFVLWYLSLIMPLWAAVIVSSVAFGAGHSYQGAAGALRCGLIGLFFAIFYVLTGSIWLPIIAHILLDILQGLMIVEILGKDQKTVAEPSSSC